MSDDRFGPDQPEVPLRRARVFQFPSPKPRLPPFDLAEECNKFLDDYCKRFGLKRAEANGGRR